MPSATFQIYEVPNSYVDTGGSVAITGVFYLSIDDDDGFLDGTAGADSGTPQVLTASFSGTIESYQFFYNDELLINGTAYSVKTFQLTVDGDTRSFIMSTSGYNLPGVDVDDTINLQSFANFTPLNYDNVACFCAGSLIRTPNGLIPVEDLSIGDLVETLDHGPQPIRWIGFSEATDRQLLARPSIAPVRIPAHVFGHNKPTHDLHLSPQHRVRLEGWAVELVTGSKDALVAAIHLVGQNGIAQARNMKDRRYFHMLFDQHEIVESNGLFTESFFLGDVISRNMKSAQRDEIEMLFPQLSLHGAALHPTSARVVMKKYEARAVQALSSQDTDDAATNDAKCDTPNTGSAA
ncbi:Hint domain-containing protein [Actibacterium lipolyticum]|uniref:Hedgehog/Intein (Hint) domain-containing protein n=1 Tax=Actibacterium lipolyticum TaxID=1524263 RepID=A0A238KWH6_9RHOB|nr:Hint domain-containing protein [Actibacterium lipolyticum]SMX47048.1 hypothetical protein COL8621_03319 [Actibacterium lipolyticum]